MKRYQTTVPIVGHLVVSHIVPDDATEEEIFEAAIDSIDDNNVEFKGVERAEIDEQLWEYPRYVTQGNVFYGSANSMTTEFEQDEDE